MGDTIHDMYCGALHGDTCTCGEPTKPFYRKGEHPHPTEGNPDVSFTPTTYPWHLRFRAAILRAWYRVFGGPHRDW